jgi:hypothetical protein
MSDTKARKSSRRPKATESLHEHFDGSQSAPFQEDEEDVAESWSSHDISAGAAAVASQRSVNNRHTSVGGSTGGTSTGSRQRREQPSRSKDGTRDRSPVGNSSVKSGQSSQQSTRSSSKRHMQSPSANSSSSRMTEGGGVRSSPYKGLSKLAVEEQRGTPQRAAKKASSGIPRAAAAAPTVAPGFASPRKTSAHHRMSAAVGNNSYSSGISSSSRSRRGSEAAAEASPATDKLQRILELGNKWKTMKQQHEVATQQATSRRVDLTKEIF